MPKSLESSLSPPDVTGGVKTGTERTLETPLSLVLNNADLLHEILSFNAIDSRPLYFKSFHSDEFVTSRKDTLSAALACRAFAGPALTLLWSVADSILPLFKLLPESIFKFRESAYVFHGRIPASFDGHRYLYYANKIKVFCYGLPETSSEVKPSISWHSFSAFAATQHNLPIPLLPRLHTLHIASLTSTGSSILFHLISPSIRSVFASNFSNVTDGTSLIGSLVMCLSHQATNLQQIDFQDTLPQDTVDLLHDCQELRYIRLVQPISLPMFITWMGASQLKTLAIKMGAYNAGPHLASRISHHSLRKLDIEAGRFMLEGLFYHLSLPTLQVLSLQIVHSEGGDSSARQGWIDSMKWLHNLGVVCPLLQYLSLHFRVEHVSHPPQTTNFGLGSNSRFNGKVPALSPPPCSAFGDLIGHLIANEPKLVLLDHLIVTGIQGLIPLSDCDYWSLAKAFPLLKRLVLPSWNRVSSHSLYNIALLCPDLQHLSIGVDCTTFPRIPERTSHAIIHRLQVLNPYDSSVDDPYLIARHLYRLFPRLETICVPSEPSIWNKVGDLFKFARACSRDDVARKVPNSDDGVVTLAPGHSQDNIFYPPQAQPASEAKPESKAKPVSTTKPESKAKPVLRASKPASRYASARPASKAGWSAAGN